MDGIGKAFEGLIGCVWVLVGAVLLLLVALIFQPDWDWSVWGLLVVFWVWLGHFLGSKL